MVPFVNVLPYVHHADFLQRLAASTVGSILVLCVLYVVSPWRRSAMRFLGIIETGRWEKTKNLVKLSLALSMFTYFGAELSPNLFGTLARVLPATAYEETVEVEKAEFYGSKYKSVSLTLRGHSTESPLHLVLSKRLFEYPRLKSGDALKLFGRNTMLGIYVMDFKLENNWLTNRSSGPKKATLFPSAELKR